MAADLDNVNPYRFSGKRIHGGTGTYDIGFRDYDPGINRFLTRDFYQGALKDLALGTDPWSTNRYTYAGGNPIGMVDLDGHKAIGVDGEECSDCDARVTQKPEGVADDESGMSNWEWMKWHWQQTAESIGTTCWGECTGGRLPTTDDGEPDMDVIKNQAKVGAAADLALLCMMFAQACAVGALESVPGAEGAAVAGGGAGGAGFLALLLGRGERGAAPGHLLGELAASGVKHSPENVVGLAKNGDGKIVFLENGNSRAGLTHILERHGADFEKAGIAQDDIADLVVQAASRGTQVGMQRTRPIYELTFQGQTTRVAVTVGDNGFIVGANPVGR
ncbi:MAG: RHS repeat-associated core domain-containing protein [Actinomycetota bacterium]|nr:RHS repeat-associated core domain-containing protein [Actinomycetota bacterium]